MPLRLGKTPSARFRLTFPTPKTSHMRIRKERLAPRATGGPRNWGSPQKRLGDVPGHACSVAVSSLDFTKPCCTVWGRDQSKGSEDNKGRRMGKCKQKE